MKDVVFFVGEALTTDLKPQEEETSDVFFINKSESVKTITYNEERSVIEKAIIFMEERL